MYCNMRSRRLYPKMNRTNHNHSIGNNRNRRGFQISALALALVLQLQLSTHSRSALAFLPQRTHHPSWSSSLSTNVAPRQLLPLPPIPAGAGTPLSLSTKPPHITPSHSHPNVNIHTPARPTTTTTFHDSLTRKNERRATTPTLQSTSTRLHALSQRTVALLDGAELSSLQSFLDAEGRTEERDEDDDDDDVGREAQEAQEERTGAGTGAGTSSGRNGRERQSENSEKRVTVAYLSIVAGTLETSSSASSSASSASSATPSSSQQETQRVVGVEMTSATEDGAPSLSLGKGVNMYADSVSTIPTGAGVSDDEAVRTYVAGVVGVHCALPFPSLPSELPSSDLPRGQDQDGSSTGRGSGGEKRVKRGRVVILGGGDYAVFAADVLAALGAEVYLVSNGNPRPKRSDVKVMKPAVGSDEVGFAQSIGTFDVLLDTLSEEPASVIDELRLQHHCTRYVSIYSQSQRIIRQKGVLFGQNDAKQYVLDAVTRSVMSKNGGSIVPPANLGTTIQAALDNNILYKGYNDAGSQRDGGVTVRRWNLKDFWEYTSWPRDAEGGDDVRYGLPISATAAEESDLVYALSQSYDAEEEEGEAVPSRRSVAAPPNPWVTQIRGVEGLNQKVVREQKHTVLFMSASWCRTCRSLKPRFTKIARETTLNDDKDDDGAEQLLFAEADTTGMNGKLLSRYLDVEAVPAFVLFRGGQLYGEPISVSRLPSKKFEKAIDMLMSGDEFDARAIERAEVSE